MSTTSDQPPEGAQPLVQVLVPTRWKLGETPTRHVGVALPWHWLVTEEYFCASCNGRFKAGDYTAVTALGPGPDEQEQEAARSGRWFNARGTVQHYACATGSAEPPPELLGGGWVLGGGEVDQGEPPPPA